MDSLAAPLRNLCLGALSLILTACGTLSSGPAIVAPSSTIRPTASASQIPATAASPTPFDTPGPAQAALPDLVVEEARAAYAPCFSSRYREWIAVRVANVGDAPAGPFMVAVAETWQAVPGGLGAGERLTLVFDMRAVHGGAEEPIAVADAASQVVERDEGNNSSPPLRLPTVTPPPPCPTDTARPATVPPNAWLPDLQLRVQSSVAPPLCFGRHSRLGLLVYVVNNGPAEAGSFAVSVNNTWQVVDGLASRASVALWFDLRPVLDWDDVVVTLDSFDEVLESDETNNVVETHVMVLTAPAPCDTPTPGPTYTPTL